MSDPNWIGYDPIFWLLAGPPLAVMWAGVAFIVRGFFRRPTPTTPEDEG